MNIRKITVLLLVCLMTISIACAESVAGRTEYKVEDDALRNQFETVYAEGQHKCGFDIDEGEYVLIASEEGAYFSISTDSNGMDILFNGIFSGNSVITIKLGEYIELQGCFAVPATEFYSKYYNDRSADGIMLKVGEEYDILPGEYKLTATSEGAYYAVFDSSIQTNILHNSIFDNSSFVTLNDGEYIVLDRCMIDGGVPTVTPSPEPTPVPTEEPTPVPTEEPTMEPTVEPTPANIEEPITEKVEETASAAEEPKETPAIIYEELKKGDNGEKVRVLQSKLISKGYLSGSADGNFGGMTETAIKEFQMANGLEVTGIADNAMQQILFYVEPVDLTNIVLTVGSKGEEVKSAQQRLIELNYLKGSADGSFGNMTASAVKDYQIAAGLPVTGEIDATTMNSIMSADAPKATVYESLNYKELSRNSGVYVGTHYKFNGTISWITENVNDATAYTTVTLGINTKGRYDDLVYIEYDREEGETRYLENDRVTIYAEFIGLYSYEAINGATITCPRFELNKIELR